MSVQKDQRLYQVNLHVRSLGFNALVADGPGECPYQGSDAVPPGARHVGDCSHCEMFMGLNAPQAAGGLRSDHAPSSDLRPGASAVACCWLKVGVDDALEVVVS